MPEGHKTHYLARQHREIFEGQTVSVTSPQGRFRAEARKVSRRTLITVAAYGKHLFYYFDNELQIHVHLGRYGKFRQHDCPPPKPVGKVRMRVVGDNVAIDLNGPTTCRVIDQRQELEILSKLGPDPLLGARKQDVWKVIGSKNKPIGALLLDQSVIAGVGNIFRAEILFDIGLDPNLNGSEMSKTQFDRLWRSTVKLMRRGLKYGKIISVTASEAGMPLSEVEGKERFWIYGKQDCPRCGGPIQTIELASRKLYLCPTCQSS